MVAPKKVTPNTLEVRFKLDVDYSMVLNRSWLPILNPILATKYMRKLMVFMHEMYKIKYITPAKEDLFAPFKLTEFDDLEVVIINDKPFPHKRHATGLALACPENCPDPPRVVEKLHKCIERTVYKGFHLDPDLTLESWANQGVLLLNASPVHIENYNDADPAMLWRDFLRKVVKEINNRKTGVQFLLLGSNAQYFQRYISKKSHYVYEYETIENALSQNRIWECPYFKEINDVLDENNGPEFCIEW